MLHFATGIAPLLLAILTPRVLARDDFSFAKSPGKMGKRFVGYKSSGVRPVCFAMRASIRGPISSLSWGMQTLRPTSRLSRESDANRAGA